MNEWKTVENPGWAGVEPRRLTGSECHDRSHFVTVECSCGEQMHMHETQWQKAEGLAIGSRCKGCGDLLVFPPSHFEGVLAEMRRQGWIA